MIEHSVLRIEAEQQHDWLAVDDAPLGEDLASGFGDVVEARREVVAVAAHDVDALTISVDERAEAVPLRLIEPSVANRKAGRRAGEHRGHGRSSGLPRLTRGARSGTRRRGTGVSDKRPDNPAREWSCCGLSSR